MPPATSSSPALGRPREGEAPAEPPCHHHTPDAPRPGPIAPAPAQPTITPWLHRQRNRAPERPALQASLPHVRAHLKIRPYQTARQW